MLGFGCGSFFSTEVKSGWVKWPVTTTLDEPEALSRSFSMVWITTLGFIGLNAAGVITCSSMFLYFLNS
jgi:hypothetical protein